MSRALQRIPVSIITGFLGAGKSTLLNRLLKDPAMRDCAVIINEFGEVGIDHLLVERSNDNIVELSDGCLCCTVRGELIDTLADLADRMQTGRLRPLKRVVIETTGLADPAPVMQSVMGNPVIGQHFGLEGVVTLVDAVNGQSTLDRHPEAVKQVAVADRIVLTKTDLASAEAMQDITDSLTVLNPRAPILHGNYPGTGALSLLETGLYNPDQKIADVKRWLGDEERDSGHHHHASGHHHHHDEPRHHHHHHHDVTRHDRSIRSFSILHDRPVSPMALEMFIDLLRSAHGEKLLRMKGIVALADDPDRPVVLHGVQQVFHPPVRLERWPDAEDRRTRLVLITQDLPEAFVTELFDAFTGTPRVDRPDRAALEDNPLAVPGMKF
ncbi:CobW family GTP-binding protein [Gellertiella hungarica]|uniref:G3E family GTPase n=1 Tax=Gellertiella hungarica TaxID=1572859 RepID=A0A7W6NLB3_9HYPH|nr:GTP-binding protein [Gellertiella hungarica]MBB4065152.1 G3E family GTPase [Gellertiella hungarica]